MVLSKIRGFFRCWAGSGAEKVVKVGVLVVLLGPLASGLGQEPATNTDAANPPANSTQNASPAGERYHIGPGDVLDIRVFNRQQLSREVRVGTDGMIQMPLIEGDIRAACRTETELAKDIANLYLKYQRNPYVNVFIKEYSSQPVAVIGEVTKPNRFQLQRRVRLLELLALAGGPTDKAGGRIQIAHTGALAICDSGTASGPAPAPEDVVPFVSYSLKDTLRGDELANPWIRPGDIISVPEADQVYVVGNVYKPQAVVLKDPITVSQAIAMAGGTMRSTKTDKIRILRPVPGTTNKKEILVDLVAINKRRAEDPLLMPNDIVDVPTDGRKLLTEKVLNALTGGLSSVPYVLR